MAGNFPDTHIHTVMCPNCGRNWTGEFKSPVPETEVCKDCIAAGEGSAKESKDVHINPKAR